MSLHSTFPSLTILRSSSLLGERSREGTTITLPSLPRERRGEIILPSLYLLSSLVLFGQCSSYLKHLVRLIPSTSSSLPSLCVLSGLLPVSVYPGLSVLEANHPLTHRSTPREVYPSMVHDSFRIMNHHVIAQHFECLRVESPTGFVPHPSLGFSLSGPPS